MAGPGFQNKKNRKRDFEKFDRYDKPERPAGDGTVIEMLRRIQQQLNFLEKKVDMLTGQGQSAGRPYRSEGGYGERPARRPQGDGSRFRRSPREDEFRSDALPPAEEFPETRGFRAKKPFSPKAPRGRRRA